ncbi:MAG: histidine phosphotransferase family protein [Hyphomicrobiales bacterium]|jgi:histidine phosphotransferase ChpT|nr:histidine phosphotransferase family protein [Hyphomicrobiales bacterium]
MMTDQPKPVAAVTLEGLDLASLLCSRVCHDVISPVGAIVNGIELYDSGDASMKEFSIDLVRKSSRQASARLQFARLAFGAAGSAGAMIDTGDAGLVANAFFADEKINLVWEVPRALLPKNQVKLILNLVMVATHAIPRGGSLTVAGTIAGEQGDFVLTATGINARMPHNAEDLIAGRAPNGVVDAHAIQPYYAGQIAQAAGMAVQFAIEGDTVTIKAGKADPA